MKHDIKHVTDCPNCKAEIRLRKRPFLGQIFTCSRCDASLEVIALNPVELDWAYDDEEEVEEDVEDDRLHVR